MSKREVIFPQIIERMPEFLRDEYPLFVTFITAYFKWLETDENFIRKLLDFKDHRDTSSNSDEYIDVLLSGLGFTSVNDINIKKSQLIVFLRDFYLSRGNEESFKFLFRVFFNTDVDVDYPRKKMATVSNSVYSSVTEIYTTGASTNSRPFKRIVEDPDSHFSTTIIGLKSHTETPVEKITNFEVAGVPFIRLSILNTENSFEVGEPVRIEYGDINITEESLAVGNVTTTSAGSGYTIGDLITVSHPDAVMQGVYRISKIKKGKIDSVSVASGGAGYSVGDLVIAQQTLKGAGFSAEVSGVNGSGAITSVKVLNGGWGYHFKPTLLIKSETGSNGELVSNSVIIGNIEQIDAIHPVVYAQTVNPSLFVIAHMSKTGSGAVLSIENASTFTNSKSNRNPLDGVLGRNCILTDSNLFQQFSYELISTESANAHAHISAMAHPTGYIRFNVLNVRSGDEMARAAANSRLRIKKKIPPQTLSQFPSSGINISTADFSYRQAYRIKTFVDYNALKPAWLSINIADEYKFSANFDFTPLDIDCPVIDSINEHAFNDETLETTIKLITV